MIGIAAIHPEEVSGTHMVLARDLTGVTPASDLSLRIKYPDGHSRTYRGMRIPNSVVVPPGSAVHLIYKGVVVKSGDYSIKVFSRSITDLPASEADEIIKVDASASSSQNTGKMSATAAVWVKRYYPGLSVMLFMGFKYESEKYHEESVSEKVVVVHCNASTTSFAQTSSPQTQSGMGEATQEGSTVTSKRALSLDPLSREIYAGDSASFNICTELSSPIFRVEHLPTGYRYVITPGEECYELRVMTHPSTYGEFEITVVARSGDIEEEGRISLMVRKKAASCTTPSAPQPATPAVNTPTAQEHTQSPTSVASPQPTARFDTGEPTTTIVTVVKKGESTDLLAAAAVVGVLVILAALLLLRRSR